MEFLFQFVFKYFWFLAPIIAVLNFIPTRARINSVVRLHPELASGANGILFGYFMFLSVPFILLGVIQLAGGYETPFFIYTAPWNDPFVLASLGVIILTWLILGYWIFFRDGARKMIDYQIIYGTGLMGLAGISKSEGGVKLGWAISLLGVILIFVFGRFMFSNLS